MSIYEGPVHRAGSAPAEVIKHAETLRAYLEDNREVFLQHEESAIFEALAGIEQYIKGER